MTQISMRKFLFTQPIRHSGRFRMIIQNLFRNNTWTSNLQIRAKYINNSEFIENHLIYHEERY